MQYRKTQICHTIGAKKMLEITIDFDINTEINLKTIVPYYIKPKKKKSFLIF